MNKTCKILFFVILSFNAKVLLSQVNEYEKSNQIYDSILSDNANFLDVLFYKHEKNVLINNLGTYGSPFYIPTVKGLFRDRELKNKNPYFSNFSKLKGIKPFTNIKYINASRREQLFSINHIQQLGNSLSFGFEYNKISSPGYYLNQEANHSKFYGFAVFKIKKYRAKFSADINRIFLQENGGILNPIDFENNFYENRRTYSVNLLTSNSSNKKYKFSLDQKINLWSLLNDSIREKNLFIKFNTLYKIGKRVFNDNEPKALIYNDIIIDSLGTIDSIYQSSLSNSFSLLYRYNKITAGLITKHQINNYFQSYGLDTLYDNLYTGALLSANLKQFSIDFFGSYGVAGYRTGDININTKLQYNINDKFYIDAIAAYNLTEPDLKFINYKSNHFSWDNYHLKKQSLLSSGIKLEIPDIKLEIEVENNLVSNYLYYDSTALANQVNKTNSLTTISFSKRYKIYNFYFITAIKYQTTPNEILFPLPSFIGRQVAYYQNYLFKKALRFQLGFNVSYSTDYYGYAYMPATTKYYIQSQNKIGNYPVFDIFFNAQLKHAQIFLKYEHFNAGWLGYNYYGAPNYPMMDRSFKFGISWNMFD